MITRALFSSIFVSFALHAATPPAVLVPVPNNSFESPVTPFVDLRIDNWQKNPKPPGFPVSDEQWEQSIGSFKNTAPGAADHIGNIDGQQAIFIFNAPGAGIFQDYDSIDWNNQTHLFKKTFEPGRSYTLTAGLIGGGGNMPEGAQILLSLYYREGTNMVTLAALPVTHSLATFSSTTNFVDFSVTVPMVKGADAWADKHIGIAITSTGPFDKPGGYWDVDNIRLTETVPTLALANPSFESPVTPFVDTRVDNWQKNPKPAGFPISDEQWDQSIGTFKNTAPGASDHIDNLDGDQAIFIFNGPGAGIIQDYDSMDYALRTHAITNKFEVGSSYNLAVRVIGGGGNMPEGATLLLNFYYRDSLTNLVPIAATTVTHSTNLFQTNTHLVEFQVATPIVQANDPWANKYIGVAITSTGPFDKPGGYWDIDNVRITTGVPTFKMEVQQSGSNLRLLWPSAAGYVYQLRASTDLQTWTDSGPLTQGTGSPIITTVPISGPGTFFTVIASRIP